MILGYAGKVAQMFSWSTMLAPPTWFANDPGGTRYGQMNRDAVQTTFRTRTAKSARLQVSRAHRAEATESDTVRTTINLCRPCRRMIHFANWAGFRSKVALQPEEQK